MERTFGIWDPPSVRQIVKWIARTLKPGSSPTEITYGSSLSQTGTPDRGVRQSSERRLAQRRGHSGRRRADAAAALDEKPRILLVEPDHKARLLYTCLFEEAGYAVYAVAESNMAVDVALGRFPDVVVMAFPGPCADRQILHLWAEDPLIASVPIVVLTSLLTFDLANRMTGAITVLDKQASPESILAEVDQLVRAMPRERLVERQLRRTLHVLRELARRTRPDEDAQERVRWLIDRLQVAILALDTQGCYVAVSRGASMLTGYSRAELIGKSIFDVELEVNPRVSERWREFLSRKQSAGSTIMVDSNGNVVSIQTEFATILPGLHACALAV